MELYLVRHGEAESKKEHPERPLTPRGKDDITKMARFLQRNGIDVKQIRHSGKKRAEETAQILGDHLSPQAGVRVTQGLAPLDTVIPIAEVMQLETYPIMLVSHLPFLENLTGLLLSGDPDRAVVRFQMGACVCLFKEEKRWSVAWAVTPDIL